MVHLTEKQINKIWKNRDCVNGQYIGDDVLVKGENIGNLDFDLSAEDIENESVTCGGFFADSYYLIIGVNYGHWYAIHEVCIDDLANRYYYD